MKNDKTLKKFVSSGGVEVYKLPVEAFPNHVTNCYLVMDDTVTLIDTGSGWKNSNDELSAGFEGIREKFDTKVQLTDVDRVIITHGHVDHFGGVIIHEGSHILDAQLHQGRVAI